MFNTEAEFEEAIISIARSNGWLIHHTRSVARNTDRGFPDLVLVRDDEIIFAELKRDGMYLSNDQRLWEAKLRRAGIRIEIWKPEQFQSIISLLKRPRPLYYETDKRIRKKRWFDKEEVTYV